MASLNDAAPVARHRVADRLAAGDSPVLVTVMVTRNGCPTDTVDWLTSRLASNVMTGDNANPTALLFAVRLPQTDPASIKAVSLTDVGTVTTPTVPPIVKVMLAPGGNSSGPLALHW